GPRSEGDVPGGPPLALADDLLDLGPDGLKGDAEGLERRGGAPFAVVEKPEQDVLGADLVLIEEPSLLLREHDDPSSPVGEALKHAKPPGIRRQRVLSPQPLNHPAPRPPPAQHDDPSSPVGEALKHAKPPGIRRQRFLAANRLYTWPSDAPYGR